MEKKDFPVPFQDCSHITSPYYAPLPDRMIIKIGYPKGYHKNSQTIYYSRFLMCVKLGYILERGMEVDHIDDNQHNDDINNLQVIPKKLNLLKMKGGLTFDVFECPECHKIFEKDSAHRHMERDTKGMICCSVECSIEHKKKRNRGLVEEKYEEEDGFVYERNFLGHIYDCTDLINLLNANGVRHCLDSRLHDVALE